MMTWVYRLADGLRHRARSRVWTPDLATGRRGEDLAHRFLQRRGFTIVARNYRTRAGSGEVDLIGWDRDTLVFVEVKSRHSVEFGAPERAIGQEKERRMMRAAGDFVRHSGIPWDRVRFDTVGVLLGDPPRIDHHRDILAVRREL